MGSQMSIGNAMRRRSPNMGSERALVALFRDNVARMTRHDRHPLVFSFHRMLWKTQICLSMGVALQSFSILLPFQVLTFLIRHHRESGRKTSSGSCLSLCLTVQEL